MAVLCRLRKIAERQFSQVSLNPAIGMARTGRVARDHPYPFHSRRDGVGAAELL